MCLHGPIRRAFQESHSHSHRPERSPPSPGSERGGTPDRPDDRSPARDRDAALGVRGPPADA